MKELKVGDKLQRIDNFNPEVIYEFEKYVSDLKTMVKMTDGSYHNVDNLKIV